ncbi:MarR family winged helix-turn-helix transcriptional regulator [Ktedonospora formicarum]|uniref:HTH marR-type domain-containing protein n=1 Tax=Ktedonospora formicarum TaxID=2778364 RepID=A0A8J3IDP8_9CHLR|nr:MarR family transcriptional regulator [Ktedonospora formicarum]GHO49434.1 hypothetical protein KSX_75970 [Ktedonospora formicarum]
MPAEHLVEELLTLTRLLRPLRTAEMTPQQYWLMRQLHKHGAQNIGDLAHTLGISASSATSACKRLEKAGLLTRQRRADDERVVQVTLTPEGNALIDAGLTRRREKLMALLDALDVDEQAQLEHLIGRLLDAAETQGLQEREVHDSNYSGSTTGETLR